jgi:YVTN family beta-propeller protein
VRNSIAAVVITALATIGCQPNDDRETTDTGLAAGRSSVSAASSAPGTDPGDAPLVFVSNEDSDDITIIDSGTDSVIATVRAGKRPRGLRLSPDGTTLFVAVSGSPKAGPGVDESKLPPPDRSADGVAVIDVATRRYVKTLPGGNDPESFDVSLDGKTVYVSNEDNGTASILDVESGTVIGTVPVGEEPEGVTLRPDGKAVYVTSEATGTVAVVDTDSRKVIATIATGERPRSIVFTPDGSKAYVTAEVAGAVAVIDARTNRPLERIVVPDSGAKPMGTAISPDGKWVYVTNGRGRTLSIIDTASDSIVASIRVGTRPWGVAVTPDGKKIYTANGPSNDVSVIDAESRRVIKTIPAGRSPWGIAIEQR